jgi:hypothetical protein
MFGYGEDGIDDGLYGAGIGGYDDAGFYETPNETYDTYGDQVAVDGYEDGVLSESQMANEFTEDANFDAMDSIITG